AVSGGLSATVSTVADGGQGALVNVTGGNTWTWPVTLQSNSAVGAAAGTQLTVSGTVQDPAAAAPLLLPVPAASLTKVGTGTVAFPGANSYAGKAFGNEGVLNLRNAQALGNSGAEVQTVAVLGASGTFSLTFNGATTIALSVGDPTLAADMQAAL